MALPKLNVKFNSLAFAKEFVGRKARHTVDGILDGIGEERLAFAIVNGKHILDYVPDKVLYDQKAKAYPYKEFIGFFTDEDAYHWISPAHIAFIQSLPHGKEWALGEIATVRSFLMSS